MRNYDDYIDDLFFELTDSPINTEDPEIKRILEKLYEAGYSDGWDDGKGWND